MYNTPHNNFMMEVSYVFPSRKAEVKYSPCNKKEIFFFRESISFGHLCPLHKSLFEMTNENNSSLILVKVSLLTGVFLDFIGSKRIILTFYLQIRASAQHFVVTFFLRLSFRENLFLGSSKEMICH